MPTCWPAQPLSMAARSGPGADAVGKAETWREAVRVRFVHHRAAHGRRTRTTVERAARNAGSRGHAPSCAPLDGEARGDSGRAAGEAAQSSRPWMWLADGVKVSIKQLMEDKYHDEGE